EKPGMGRGALLSDRGAGDGGGSDRGGGGAEYAAAPPPGFHAHLDRRELLGQRGAGRAPARGSAQGRRAGGMTATRRRAAILRRRCMKVCFQSIGITSRANREWPESTQLGRSLTPPGRAASGKQYALG